MPNADWSRTLCIVTIAIILLGTVAPVGLTGQATASPAPQQPEVDNTVTRISVYPNGTAVWTVQIRTRLADQSQLETYREFQSQFREQQSEYRTQFRDRMTAVVANAANETDREMRATNFTVSTSIQKMPRQWGIVTYQFTWHGFAAQTGNETVVVGDGFSGGFYLAADDLLTIEPATENQTITAVEPTPATQTDDDGVTWVGATDFSDGYPRVEFSTQSQTPTEPSWGSSLPLNPVIGVLAIVLLLAGTVLVIRSPVLPVRGSDDQPSTDESESTETQSQSNTPEREMLTSEELVLEYLDDNGRVPQSEISEEFDWSSSKTSRILSEMAENGEISKFRLGRKNVIEPVDDDAHEESSGS